MHQCWPYIATRVAHLRLPPLLSCCPPPHATATPAPSLLQEQRSGGSSLWVLKEDVHRGKGVGVVTPRQALAQALDRAPDGGSVWGWGWGSGWGKGWSWGGRGRGPSYKHVVAQRFLEQQYLVGGRPFYIRCGGRCSAGGVVVLSVCVWVCVGVCVAIRLVDWGLAVACRQLPLSVACPSPLAAPDIFACPCSNLAAGCGRC